MTACSITLVFSVDVVVLGYRATVSCFFYFTRCVAESVYWLIRGQWYTEMIACGKRLPQLLAGDTYILTHTHAHIYKHGHSQTRTHIRTCTLAHRGTRARMQTCTHIYLHIHTHTHAQTNMHPHIYSRIHEYARTHTYIYFKKETKYILWKLLRNVMLLVW